MPIILFAIFVIIPILEIAAFIQVGSLVGLPLTLAGIVLTAVIGAFLVRQQGFKAIDDAKTNLESEKFPIEQVIHGVFILVAGLLLLTPGFLTDTIGFLFLIPSLRLSIAKKVWSWLKDNASINIVGNGTMEDGGFSPTGRHYRGNNENDPNTIDGSAVEINTKADRLK